VLHAAGAPPAEMAGTPAYMAPESFEGRYSAASDLWSAAIVFHQLLAGGLRTARRHPACR